MNAPNGGERVAQALLGHGVRTLFTLCGGHISPVLSAAKARGIRVVDVRDEATAVFAADATARLTGIPGVAAVTAGPGITNTITALKNAQLAQSPLVLIGGAAPTALQGRGALQDIDQRPLVAPHVKKFIRVRQVRELAPAIDEAFFVAREGVPGPVFVECAVDLLYDEASIRQWYAQAAGEGRSIPDRALRWYLTRHANRMFEGSAEPVVSHMQPAPAPQVSRGTIRSAAAALARAQRPLLVVGSQAVVEAAQASELARAVGELGMPAYLSGMARGLLGADPPLLLRHARREALREADCVVLAGVPCDFRLDYGRHVRRGAVLVAANRSAHDARMNRRPTITAIGDAGAFVRELAREAGGLQRPDWVGLLRARDAAREQEIDAQAQEPGEHVNPLALLRALDRDLGGDAVLVADGGDFVSTASYVLHARGPLSWLDPGAFGTLGVGAGFALAAAIARPSREVWIVFGDGACGWSLAEFDTFVRHRIPVIAVVGNDAGWTQIAREQVKMLHDDVATVLARTAYHEVAGGFGAAGFLVRTLGEWPQAVAGARAAARAGRPALINVWLAKSAFREGSLSM